jgi:riboflavin biosynthesis pyrimidine reductase
VIEALFPVGIPGALDDDALLALYAHGAAAAAATSSGPVLGLEVGVAPAVPPAVPAAGWLRVNFVASVDGSATVDGLSGSLGGPDDLRVFDLLRRLSDVVLVASGTVRDEGYGAMRLHDADVAWRRAHRMADHPVFAIVSGTLNLDPASSIFTDAPVRPLVLTVASAPDDRRAALRAVADVVDCGADTVDAGVVRRVLVERGLPRIACEGGPSFLGTLIAADAVDELCLSIGPVLEGGAGPRIARGSSPEPRGMELGHVLRAGDLLLTRYVSTRPSGGASASDSVEG